MTSWCDDMTLQSLEVNGAQNWESMAENYVHLKNESGEGGFYTTNESVRSRRSIFLFYKEQELAPKRYVYLL